MQGPTSEPDTAWSELAGCAEITCNMIWIRDFASAYYGGMAEVLGGLLYMGCGPCQAWTAVSGAITTFSDLDAHFARAAAAKEVFDEFWKDPWNNFWRPIGEDWANDPGHALGVTMTTAATLLLPTKRVPVAVSGEAAAIKAIRPPPVVGTVIAQGKIDYLLKDPSKAGVFADRLGFDQATLEAALQSHLMDNLASAVFREMYEGKTKLSVTGPMTGPSGKTWEITSAWEILDEETVRLITATP